MDDLLTLMKHSTKNSSHFNTMKKTTTILLAATLTLTSANAYRDMIIDGVIGAAAGAAIGNNMGEGDAETGAVIGGVSAVIFGEKGRSSRVRSNKSCYPHTSSCGSRSVAIVKEQPKVEAYDKEIEVKERVWVPDEVVTDANGNALYTIPGHHETRIVKKTITVYR